ncbi:MAG TPA: hypothetical protein ENF93_01665 [Ignisphaera sp.]|nr:hypothetical protein [Ignisphaera sp.]
MGAILKAAYVYSSRDIRVIDVPKPRVEKLDDVVIEVKACGVCPFDLRIYLGLFKARPPIPVGHEVAGIVEEVGKDVTHVSPGDVVAIDAMIRCGVCEYCRRGLDNLCERKGPLPHGFAEYMRFPARYVYRAPKTVDFDELALCEPLACCINAIEKCGELFPGDVVHIVGAGPIGLMFLKLFKFMGLKTIVSEVLDHRVKAAKACGADLVLNPEIDDVEKGILDHTYGYGANVTVLTATSREIFSLALKSTAKAGTILLFAARYPPITVEFDPNVVHFKELRIVGVEARTMKHFYKAFRLITSRAIVLKDLISHRFKLEEIREAFEFALQRKGLKIVVTP